MAERLALTLACDDYEHTRPLIEGQVVPDGITLLPQQGLSIAERQLRMLHDFAFDLCELSVTTYFLAREKGLPVTALPIFPLRRFRHGDIHINTARGIRGPKDLIGKRVGGLSYQVASNVWARGILSEYYDVPHDSITWVIERDEEVSFAVPANLRIDRLNTGKSVEAALLAGEIDALISPVVPGSILAADPRVARLLPDFKTVEAQYYRKSGIFPIMHVLAVKNALIERDPWMAGSLVTAFTASKQRAYQRMSGIRSIPLAWFGSAWEEERKILGQDPWAYGFGKANKLNLETIRRYMVEQGLLQTAINIADLFVDV